MRMLLTGGTGQLGTALQKHAAFIAPPRSMLDVTNRDSVQQVLGALQPDLVVHAAAYTDTFGAESSAFNMLRCWNTNVLGTRNLVDFAQCPIVLISTEAAIRPYSFYILSKIQAESEVMRHIPGFMVLRTSFRSEPFEYDKAFTDMWTLGDGVSVIAPLLLEKIRAGADRRVRYVGTGPKTMFDLARRTRPDVQPCSRLDVSPYLPSLEELRHVEGVVS